MWLRGGLCVRRFFRSPSDTFGVLGHLLHDFQHKSRVGAVIMHLYDDYNKSSFKVGTRQYSRHYSYATHNTQHTTHNTQHTTHNTQHATRNTQHATSNKATCNTQ